MRQRTWKFDAKTIKMGAFLTSWLVCFGHGYLLTHLHWYDTMFEISCSKVSSLKYLLNSNHKMQRRKLAPKKLLKNIHAFKRESPSNWSIAFRVGKSVSFKLCPWTYFDPKVIETALVFGDISKDVLMLKWVDMLKSIFMKRVFQLFWKYLVKKCLERRQKKLLKQQPATKTCEHAGEKAGDKIIQLLSKKNKNTITPSIYSISNRKSSNKRIKSGFP